MSHRYAVDSSILRNNLTAEEEQAQAKWDRARARKQAVLAQRNNALKLKRGRARRRRAQWHSVCRAAACPGRLRNQLTAVERVTHHASVPAKQQNP